MIKSIIIMIIIYISKYLANDLDLLICYKSEVAIHIHIYSLCFIWRSSIFFEIFNEKSLPILHKFTTFCAKRDPSCSVLRTLDLAFHCVYIPLTHQNMICLHLWLAVIREVPYLAIYTIVILFTIFSLKMIFL